MDSPTLTYPAKGAMTLSTAWTSTGPFSGQSTRGYNVTRGIYAGVTGDLKVIMYDGSTGIFPAIPAGQIMPIRAIALSSNNTAASLVGLF